MRYKDWPIEFFLEKRKDIVVRALGTVQCEKLLKPTAYGVAQKISVVETVWTIPEIGTKKKSRTASCGDHVETRRFSHRFPQFYQNVSKCVNKSFNVYF